MSKTINSSDIVAILNRAIMGEMPKRSYNKDFKVGRQHRVKYERVLLVDSNEVRYKFKVKDIVFYTIDIPKVNDIIVSNNNNNKYKVRVLSVDKNKILIQDYSEEV